MENGFENFEKPWAIERGAVKTRFCPAKATWYEDIQTMFSDCVIAYETGLLPKPGYLSDQSEMFMDVFRYFVQRWSDKRYNRIWSDIGEFTPKVLEQLAKIMGKMLGG